MNKFFDIKFLKFIVVGLGNTMFSAIVMFLLYNITGFGYWGSSAISYILGSVLSFVLNKNFTFQNKDSLFKTAVKFSVTVTVCYFAAFYFAKPAVNVILARTLISKGNIEQISMLFGMFIYTMLNFVGQRFFAFKYK